MNAYLNPYDKLMAEGKSRISQCSFDNILKRRFRSLSSSVRLINVITEPRITRSSNCLPFIHIKSESINKICDNDPKKTVKNNSNIFKISSFDVGKLKDIDAAIQILFSKNQKTEINSISNVITQSPNLRKDKFGNQIVKKGKIHKICFADSLNNQAKPFVQTKKDVSYSRITRKMKTLYNSEVKNDWNCSVY